MRATGLGRKIGLLSALYFAEGLPYGFQATALPAYLRKTGVSLTGIGFIGALSLPWILKPLWAPLVDRFHIARLGKRRTWILPMQAALAITCALAALVSPKDDLILLLALVFLMNFFAATQDIAIDGLAIDLLSESELGRGNAVQVVGYKVGMLTGGGLLVWASTWIGWQGLFLTMAAFVLCVLAVTALSSEPGAAISQDASAIGIVTVLERVRDLFRTPGAIWLVVFVATYKIGEAMISAMFKPFLVDAGFTPETIGLWIGTYGMIASLLGSVAGGWLATRFPLLQAVAIAAVLRAISMAGEITIAVFGPTEASVILVTIAESFFSGAVTTAMFAFMMSLVDRRIGATHYALLASIEVLGKSPGAWLSGPLAERFGFAALFAIGTALSATFLLVIFPLRRSMFMAARSSTMVGR